MSEPISKDLSLERNLPVLDDALDEFWTQYLSHLDNYQKAQAEIAQLLSCGFFSLAQANFKSQDRRRYGKDCYDERMKASRRFQITAKEEEHGDFIPAFAIKSVINTKDEGLPAKSEDDNKIPIQQPSPPTTPAPEEPASTADEKLQPEDPSAGPSKPSDPLHWFGILIPRELRSAQSSFSLVVKDSVLRATGSAKKMRELEAQIERARKGIKKAKKEARE